MMKAVFLGAAMATTLLAGASLAADGETLAGVKNRDKLV